MSKEIKNILSKYQKSFLSKRFPVEKNDSDLLMDVFNIDSKLKRENKQYWGRELGMCWQNMVTEICKSHCSNFSPPKKFGSDEPYDIGVGILAIDTKYRIGSGDSGTLKKFKKYGKDLKDLGMTPVFLILRDDNLPAAINACNVGGWEVYTGEKTFDYIKKLTGYDLKEFLIENKSKYSIF